MMVDIDFMSLQPGDIFTQSQCEQLLGVKREGNEYQYQFELMRLGDFFSRSLRKIGRNYTVRTTDAHLQILTHEEASAFNASQFDAAIGKMRRCNKRLNSVDVSKLTVEARQSHEKALVKQSRILTLMKASRAEIVLEQTKQVRPTRRKVSVEP